MPWEFKMIERILQKVIQQFFPKKIPNILEALSKDAFTKQSGIAFYTPTFLSAWRAETLLTKEPATIAWIDSFADGETLWDVGANVGVYSLYAAVKKQIQVCAFEPSPFNFEILSKNMMLNNISNKINAYCLAFSDQTKMSMLNMTSVVGGAAHSGFDHTVNEFGQSFQPQYSQSTLGYKMDDFVEHFSMALPNHIKIDVDGSEQAVIYGGEKLLQAESLRSILIELPTELRDIDKAVTTLIEKNGFQLKSQAHPGGDENLTNYIFAR